jgi:hypothetical protein
MKYHVRISSQILSMISPVYDESRGYVDISRGLEWTATFERA